MSEGEGEEKRKGCGVSTQHTAHSTQHTAHSTHLDGHDKAEKGDHDGGKGFASRKVALLVGLVVVVEVICFVRVGFAKHLEGGEKWVSSRSQVR